MLLLHAEAEILRFVTFNFKVVISDSQSLIYFFGHLFSAGVWNGAPETIMQTIMFILLNKRM